MNEQVQVIRAEIERLLKENDYDWIGKPAAEWAYRKVLSFIDSLPEETSYDTQKLVPRPCVDIEDVARVQFASHAHLIERKRKAVLDWEQFKKVVGIFYAFGKEKTLFDAPSFPTSTEMIAEWQKAKDCKESKNIGKTCQNFTKPSDDELKIVEDSAHLGPSCTADENGVRIESHPIGPDNFRSEVVRFCNEHFDELHSDMETIDIVHIIAHHFAEWQKKQDQETIELAEDHAMLAGRMQMKEEIGRRIDEELSENDAWKAVSPDDRFFGGYGIALENIKDKIESL